MSDFMAPKPKGWVYIETKVHDNAASPNAAWTDLDLSGTSLGPRRALVRMKIKQRQNTAMEVAFRMNGDTDNYEAGTTTGSSRCDLPITDGACRTVECHTDAGGIVEWRTTSAANTDVYLVGYILA